MSTPDLLTANISTDIITGIADRINAGNQKSEESIQTLIDTLREAVSTLGDTAGVSVHDDSPTGELYVEFDGQNFLISVEEM